MISYNFRELIGQCIQIQHAKVESSDFIVQVEGRHIALIKIKPNPFEHYQSTYTDTYR